MRPVNRCDWDGPDSTRELSPSPVPTGRLGALGVAVESATVASPLHWKKMTISRVVSADDTAGAASHAVELRRLGASYGSPTRTP